MKVYKEEELSDITGFETVDQYEEYLKKLTNGEI